MKTALGVLLILALGAVPAWAVLGEYESSVSLDQEYMRGEIRAGAHQGCKSAQGELHARMVVSASEKGRTRLQVIARGFLGEVEERVRRYQELRRARARLLAIHREMLKVLDEVEAMRREISLLLTRSSLPRDNRMELVILEENKPLVMEVVSAADQDNKWPKGSVKTRRSQKPFF